MPLYKFLHILLNVLVYIANKMGLQKKSYYNKHKKDEYLFTQVMYLCMKYDLLMERGKLRRTQKHVHLCPNGNSHNWNYKIEFILMCLWYN
jgi:hypothetical protein